MRIINANAVRDRSHENFFTRKFIIRKFLHTKISRSTVVTHILSWITRCLALITTNGGLSLRELSHPTQLLPSGGRYDMISFLTNILQCFIPISILTFSPIFKYTVDHVARLESQCFHEISVS